MASIEEMSREELEQLSDAIQNLRKVILELADKHARENTGNMLFHMNFLTLNAIHALAGRTMDAQVDAIHEYNDKYKHESDLR